MDAKLTRRSAIQSAGAVFAIPAIQSSHLESSCMPFTPKFVDLVRNLTSVTGTGPVTLGQAVNGFTSLASAVIPGDQFYYCIQGVDKPQEREVGRGTMQADGRVARQPVLGPGTNFSTGTKTIALVAAAEWFSKLDGSMPAAASRAELAARDSEGAGRAFLSEDGRAGNFVFDPSDLSAKVAADPEQGIHVAPASDASGTSGAWVRRFDGAVNVKWFGAKGDGTTDDSAAFVAAISLLKAMVVSGFGYGAGSARLFVPSDVYFLGSTTLDITHSIHILGEGCGATAGGTSVLKWSPGTTGIRIQAPNTTGSTGVQPMAPHGGGNSIIEGLLLRGGMTTTEGEFHGVHMRAGCAVKNCSIYNFQGDGVHINATAGGGAPIEGNANGFLIERVHSEGNRHGFFIDGADANIGLILACNAKTNRAWGFWDSSFLGNTYLACHAAANGWDGAASFIPTGCTYSSKRYAVRPGQEAGASTNAPSGTTADNDWWIYHSPGGSYNGVVPWVSGTSFRAGGAYYLTNPNARNALFGSYSETDQNHSWIMSPSVAFGGLVSLVKGNGSYIRSAIGATVIDSLQASTLETLGIVTARDFVNFHGAGGLLDGQIRGNDTNRALTITGVDYVSFSNFTDFIANFQTSGLDLAAGKSVSVAGTKVIGARGAALPADATDLASAIALVNAIKARMVAHGLVA